MRSDCGDIILTDSDGSATLYYWIESGVNTSSTKIWVKIPSILAGIKTIYLYYGNPTATYNNSLGGTNTFDFFENFDDGDISDWAMTNYYLTVSSSSSADNTYYISPPYSLRIYNYANCTVPPYSGGETRMLKTVSLSNNTYVADLYQKMTGVRYNKCEFGNTVLGVLFYIDDVSYFSRYCTPGTCSIMTTCDTQLGTSSSFTITTGSAKISLSVYSGDCNYITGWFDDVRIRKYSSPEPTFSSIGSEELPTGSLNISSTPSGAIGASVYIDSNPILSGVTPLIITGFTPGTHNYRLTKTGYTEIPETNFTITAEQTTTISQAMLTVANITTTNMTITPSSTPCREGTCTITIVIRWSNSGETNGTVIPNITIDTVSQIAHTSRTVLAGSYIDEIFIVSDLSTGIHTICPYPN